MSEPGSLRVISDLFPRVTRYWTRWNRIIKANIDRSIFWNNSTFDFTHMRMLSSSSENTWWFNVVISNFFNVSIDQTYGISSIFYNFIFGLFLSYFNWSVFLFLFLFEIIFTDFEAIDVCQFGYTVFLKKQKLWKMWKIKLTLSIFAPKYSQKLFLTVSLSPNSETSSLLHQVAYSWSS